MSQQSEWADKTQLGVALLKATINNDKESIKVLTADLSDAFTGLTSVSFTMLHMLTSTAFDSTGEDITPENMIQVLDAWVLDLSNKRIDE